jgi:hypothetical protein
VIAHWIANTPRPLIFDHRGLILNASLRGTYLDAAGRRLSSPPLTTDFFFLVAKRAPKVRLIPNADDPSLIEPVELKAA